VCLAMLNVYAQLWPRGHSGSRSEPFGFQHMVTAHASQSDARAVKLSFMTKAHSKPRMIAPRLRARGVRLPSGNPTIAATSKPAATVISLAQQRVLSVVKQNGALKLDTLLAKLRQQRAGRRRYATWITRCLIKSGHLKAKS